jgi:hypothetical protein
MHKIFSYRIGWVFAIYGFLLIICTGMGMGVPFFCILLGFPVGWYIARRVYNPSHAVKTMLKRVLMWAALTSGITLVIMAILWGASTSLLFEPGFDIANFGMPIILYEPMASFIGWMVLMIVISPFLQFLMTLFGAQVTLLRIIPEKYK